MASNKRSGGGGGRGGGGGAATAANERATANLARASAPLTQERRQDLNIKTDSFINRPTRARFEQAVEAQMNLSVMLTGRPITRAQARQFVVNRIQGRPGGTQALQREGLI